jgi:hypothetical protein
VDPDAGSLAVTILCAAVGGAALLLALELAVLLLFRAWGERRWGRAESARSTFAVIVRSMSLASGFESVVLYMRSDPIIIGFEEVARALDKGQVLGRTDPRPTKAPPAIDESYDGHA